MRTIGLWLALTTGSLLAAERTITVSFDEVNVVHGAVIANKYLAKRGLLLRDVTAGSVVAIVNVQDLYEGRGLVASSAPNALTQVHSNDPVSFTLDLPAAMRTVRFTRPQLVAGPTGVTFPEWHAEALDEAGRVVDEVGEPLGGGKRYYSDIPAQGFTLAAPVIRAVRFRSINYHFAGFSAVVIDDLVLIPADTTP